MVDIATLLKNLYAAIKKVLGRELTSKEKTDVQKSLGISNPTNNVTFPYIYYIQANDVAGVDVNKLKSYGVTDVFVKVSRIQGNSNYWKTFLPTVVQKFKSSGIRVHAWVACFIDQNGSWVDPNQLKIRNDIVAAVDGIKKIGVYGIHLDYIRYPGTAKGKTDPITSMVKTIRERTKGLVLTAAVMPEGSSNAQYYGQDYAALAKYLDGLVPMVYKGNYGKASSWITSTVKYIAAKAPGKVIPALQTYKSDINTAKLTSAELKADILAAQAGGCNGIALFRYGLSNFTGPAVTTTKPVTPAPVPSKPVEIKPTTYKPDKDGCLNSPRYLKDSDMKQNKGTWCALNAIQQLFMELYGLKVKEEDLYKYGFTGIDGTAPKDLATILTTHAKKLGKQVKIETFTFKQMGWDKIGQAVANPNIGVFFHELYKNTDGHYDYPVSICPKNIYMANSLEGKVIGYPRATMEKWFQGISANSIWIVTKIK